jgi:F0F1-type ATP synthase assembly protein I
VAEDPVSPRKSNALVIAARYSEIGFVIPAAVFLGYLLGRLLDRWLHTHWIFIAGVIFGAIAGFVLMIRMASAAARGKE